jgi:hypothetical protein
MVMNCMISYGGGGWSNGISYQLITQRHEGMNIRGLQEKQPAGGNPYYLCLTTVNCRCYAPGYESGIGAGLKRESQRALIYSVYQ